MTESASEPLADRYCSNESCSFGQSGVCFLGEDLDQCENLHWSSDGETAETPGLHSFGPLRCLDIEQLGSLISATNPERCALLGDIGVGKTTFLARLYFEYVANSKGWSDDTFAGSLSFMSFNEIYHYADMKSGRHTAEIERTPAGFIGVYHLETADENGDRTDHVLIDVPGEALQAMANVQSYVDEDHCRPLKRLTRVALFLDATKLDNGWRARVDASLGGLANGVAKGLWKGLPLLVTFSKMDSAHEQFDRVRAEVEGRIRRQFGASFSSIDFAELRSLDADIAASRDAAQTVWEFIDSQRPSPEKEIYCA